MVPDHDPEVAATVRLVSVVVTCTLFTEPPATATVGLVPPEMVTVEALPPEIILIAGLPELTLT